ncbi:hypothetical protein MHU86_1964 [Fragilaria crotonensis]|nr:hypothetical protein MHU86_1964 [Fragilaria crotonensis]
MEKRISQGGVKPTNQICSFERSLTATYVNTFEAQRTLDPLKEAQDQSLTNIWTDMEKCIFLDRFLQHPKDFRKIASFLRNKSTRDCVAFYYNSKQSVPYKQALKEFLMRRKRRGDYQNWDATIEASLSCGATVTAGTGEDKPLVFTLPDDDASFHTYDLHPIKRKLLDTVDVSAEDYDEDVYEEFLATKNRKRKREPLFKLEKRAQKYLKSSTQEALSGVTKEKLLSGDRSPAGRKAPQKWTTAEKKLFQEIVGEHGKNWTVLEEAIGNKTTAQIKNYYYDHKKQFGKQGSLGVEEKAADIDVDIPRKKVPIPSVDTTVESSEAIKAALRERDRESQLHREQIQHQQNESSVASDFHQQAILELSTRRLVEAQGDGQRTPEHEAVLLLQQQQQQQQQQHHFLQQHAAQEEARRLLQSQLGLSGLSALSPWASQLVALQQQQQQHQQHAHHHHHHQQHHQHQHQQQQQQQQHPDNVVRDFREAQTLQNALGLGQSHGFSIDPQAQLRNLLLRYQNPAQGSATSVFLQQLENATQQQQQQQHSGVDRLSALGGASDPMSLLRGTGGLAPAPSPASIAEAIAMLSRSLGDRGGYSQQDQHDLRRDHY